MNQQMTYRRLGQAGIKVSAFSLGGWTTFGSGTVSEEETRKIICHAFDHGINFFDIADIYSHGEAEKAMGRVFREFPRHELVISSKVYWPMSDDPNDRGLSRKHIIESVNKSLKRIGTDYLDLYFCHRFDDETPVEETVRAMDDLVRQGKVLYWGTSEWSGAQLRQAHAIADRRNAYAPTVEQPQYNLMARQRVEGDVGSAAQDLGMGLVVWSPLASGVLTGKYDDGVPANSRLSRMEWLRARQLTEENLQRIRTMKEIADAVGLSRTQLALAWTLRNPLVSSVILGATTTTQLEENLSALPVTLDDNTAAKLDELFAVPPHVDA